MKFNATGLWPSPPPGSSRPRAVVARMRRSVRQWWGDQRTVDPQARAVFSVLDMQMRLTTVTAMLRRIDTDPHMFARQHHWRTTLWAYDALLGDACALAGVAVHEAPAGPKADAERQRRELELYSRGWTW